MNRTTHQPHQAPDTFGAFSYPEENMTKASAATIDALARRNYEAAMEAPWETAAPEVRADWIEEATEQCAIVIDGMETDKTIEPLWEAMDCPDVTDDPFYDDFDEDAR